MEQSVLCTLRFVNRYPQRGDALVERATLAFDRRANLECARSGEMVAAPLCLVERFRAAVIGRIETTESNPNLGEVEPDHVLDNGVVAIHRDGEAALEISARLLEVPDLGVKDSEVVEYPGHWLGVAVHLEGAKAVGVEGHRLCVIAARARQHATILLDHSK